MTKVSIVLTNDWEIYGEGTGDFYELQERRLKELLRVVESHSARLTVMAEVGQQMAHIKASQNFPWAMAIAQDWEKSLRSTISRGHDVQLHWHPTWYGAQHDGTRWNLNLDTWSLADLPAEVVENELKKGQRYLNMLGQAINPFYKCTAFRAGAFCLQPTERILPILKKLGLSDTSVIPGSWDYLYFDYRKVSSMQGPYWIAGSDLIQNQEKNPQAILEMPVHAETLWDFPLIRRLFSRNWAIARIFGVKPDAQYIHWARKRDQKIKELFPVADPISSKRWMARLSPSRWISYIFRRSSYFLDYDFLQPAVFTALVKRAAQNAAKEGRSEVTLVALGHANNSHSFENLDRILTQLRQEFGSQLCFKTLQEVVEQNSAKSGNVVPLPVKPRVDEAPPLSISAI